MFSIDPPFALPDDDVTLELNPANFPAGQKFKEWEFTPGTVSAYADDDDDTVWTFAMPDEPVTVKAVFEDILPELDVTGDTEFELATFAAKNNVVIDVADYFATQNGATGIVYSATPSAELRATDNGDGTFTIRSAVETGTGTVTLSAKKGSDEATKVEVELEFTITSTNFGATFYEVANWEKVIGEDNSDMPKLGSDDNAGGISFSYANACVDAGISFEEDKVTTLSFMVKVDQESWYSSGNKTWTIRFGSTEHSASGQQPGDNSYTADSYYVLRQAWDNFFLGSSGPSGQNDDTEWFCETKNIAGYSPDQYNQIDIVVDRTVSGVVTITVFLNGTQLEFSTSKTVTDMEVGSSGELIDSRDMIPMGTWFVVKTDWLGGLHWFKPVPLAD